MTIKEAMETRHTVRRYTDRAISRKVAARRMERIAAHNAQYRLSMELVQDDTGAFGPLLRLVLAKGVRNYIILAGEDREDLEERLGYCGADVMLYARTLGLDTWWVGGTFSRKAVRKKAGEVAGRVARGATGEEAKGATREAAGEEKRAPEKISGIIVVGYGATQGKSHRSKSAEEISVYKGETPGWFKAGVQAVLLAPTALNKQAFWIAGEKDQVEMSCDNGIFSGIDLGIGRYHFEVGAGKEHFRWR